AGRERGLGGGEGVARHVLHAGRDDERVVRLGVQRALGLEDDDVPTAAGVHDGRDGLVVAGAVEVDGAAGEGGPVDATGGEGGAGGDGRRHVRPGRPVGRRRRRHLRDVGGQIDCKRRRGGEAGRRR